MWEKQYGSKEKLKYHDFKKNLQKCKIMQKSRTQNWVDLRLHFQRHIPKTLRRPH